MVTSTGHIGIHEGADGRTDVDDVMAIKPNFLTSMGYHIFLTMVLRARAPSARGAPLQIRAARVITGSDWEVRSTQIHCAFKGKSLADRRENDISNL